MKKSFLSATAQDPARGQKSLCCTSGIEILSGLSTANLADGVIKLGLRLRLAPAEVVSLSGHTLISGAARPARHAGSVDIFLEAINLSSPGDILVIDNQGLMDEGAIGDLIVHEAKAAGLGGIILWGCHRDTHEILEIGLPLWSLGAYPSGPVRLEQQENLALQKAWVGDVVVTSTDIVVGDEDGVIFLPGKELNAIASTAKTIRKKETAHVKKLKKGTPLRQQLRFEQFLERRSLDPAFTFREHLNEIGGAIEI